MTEPWLEHMILYLASEPQEITAQQMAERISQALEIAEVEKYATDKSRFGFKLMGATPDDVAEIRRHLSAFENSIVEIEIESVG